MNVDAFPPIYQLRAMKMGAWVYNYLSLVLCTTPQVYWGSPAFRSARALTTLAPEVATLAPRPPGHLLYFVLRGDQGAGAGGGLSMEPK